MHEVFEHSEIAEPLVEAMGIARIVMLRAVNAHTARSDAEKVRRGGIEIEGRVGEPNLMMSLCSGVRL